MQGRTLFLGEDLFEQSARARGVGDTGCGLRGDGVIARVVAVEGDRDNDRLESLLRLTECVLDLRKDALGLPVVRIDSDRASGRVQRGG
jgi:hypothetical protein